MVRQLVLKGKHQSQLEHLLLHSHQNVKGSIAPKLLGLQTVVESQLLREVEGHLLVLKDSHQ